MLTRMPSLSGPPPYTLHQDGSSACTSLPRFALHNCSVSHSVFSCFASQYAPSDTSEFTPLIPRPFTNRRKNERCCILAFFVISLIFYCRYLYLSSERLDDQQKWENELRQHRLDEEIRKDQWEQEFAKRQREGAERQERERLKWENDLQQHRLDEERRLNEWEQKFNKRQREEAERREHVKKREEQWQREEEERERLGLYWDIPQGARCAGYNTRLYSARLLNTVPYNYNWLKPCQEIPLVIHGKALQTSRCEVQVTSFMNQC